MSACRNCGVDLRDYPRARDGFCVPSHADGGDNRLEMEAGMYEVTWWRDAVAPSTLLADEGMAVVTRGEGV